MAQVTMNLADQTSSEKIWEQKLSVKCSECKHHRITRILRGGVWIKERWCDSSTRCTGGNRYKYKGEQNE